MSMSRPISPPSSWTPPTRGNSSTFWIRTAMARRSTTGRHGRGCWFGGGPRTTILLPLLEEEGLE
ncbi:unnamed protein product [Durusdinium trenchii]|uniref:Uncharacterized protein n=1 Tax=Durusdinium trenchii TaxID=1381693 RepID=A0ABP0J5L6_9DINO